MVNTENGDVYGCYYDDANSTNDWSECTSFYTELAKKLKYVKYCSSNAYQNGCVPEYSKYNPEDDNNMCPEFKKTRVESVSRAWILNDESIIFTYGSGVAPVFAVDINGLKGPNKGGFDLFSLKMVKKGNSIILEGACYGSFLDNNSKTVKGMF